MNLAQAGIALKCRCGAHMGSDMANVLFDDKGRVKISGQPIRCPVCGAIYRYGERLKYQLVRIEISAGNNAGNNALSGPKKRI